MWLIKKIRGFILCLQKHGAAYTAQLLKEKIHRKRKHIESEGLQGKILQIIRLKTYDPKQKVSYIYLFGKQIYPGSHSKFHNDWIDSSQPVFYFKVNRLSSYTIPCIQHWINIVYRLHSDFYFLCDNKVLEREILLKVRFRGPSVKFIHSIKKPMESFIDNIATPRWRNAAFAHLTPFYHANSHGIRQFWAVDADDTMICLHYYRAAQLLEEARKLAEKEKMALFSLDMWRSRTRGRHWSFGIVYTNLDNHPVDFPTLFSQTVDLKWVVPYQDIGMDTGYNADGFFTYLKDAKGLAAETFYMENVYFIHWGDFLRMPISASVCVWKDGKVEFPILQSVFGDSTLGQIDLADCRRISINAGLQEGHRFMENEVSLLRTYAPPLRKFHGLGEFATHPQEYL